MSLLHLARPEDIDRLEPLVARLHAHQGLDTTEAQRRTALAPLLDGSPHGAVYLIGPRSAPVGYVAISFGWSVGMGGLDGFIDEFFIRDKVRGRGMGGEALRSLLPVLESHGVATIHLEVDRSNAAALRLYRRLGFEAREDALILTRTA